MSRKSGFIVNANQHSERLCRLILRFDEGVAMLREAGVEMDDEDDLRLVTSLP